MLIFFSFVMHLYVWTLYIDVVYVSWMFFMMWNLRVLLGSFHGMAYLS